MRFVLLFSLILISCGSDESDPPTWIDTRALDEAPLDTISEMGIFKNGFQDPHSKAVKYEPVWPLWSNGLTKDRWIVLPDGETISTDSDWEFPVGTLMFKSFSDDNGPVETRVMWRTADEWEWSTYVWNDDKTDAEKTEGRRSVDVDVVVDGNSFTHNVPNELDCKKCHEPDSNGVMGFEPLQLGEAVETISLFDETPTVETISADDSETEAILGYFVGNCTSCHNGVGDHDQSSFDLSPAIALENIINMETESSASVDGIRVIPGDAENSVLFAAVSGETEDPELKLMPPLGVEVRDEDAIARLRSWIEGLQ